MTNKDKIKDKLKSKLKAIRRQEEEKRTQALATELDLSYIDLSTIPIDPSGLKIVPLKQAKESKIVVLKKLGKTIKIAAKNPNDKKTKTLLEELKKKEFTPEIFIASQTSLENAWKRFRVKKERKKIIREVEITSGKIGQFQEEISTFKDVKSRLESASKMTVSEMLEIILAGSLKIDASDVHFEAEEEQIRLRFRVDGILQDITDFPTTLYNSILSRVKILSELKINVHDLPQDGHFSIVMDEVEVEIRTSIIPAAYGENIVLRILNPDTISLELKDLGLEEYAMEIIDRELKRPNGMIVNTGPTGSGKTTTLYAFLKKVNNPQIKVITLENPIEYHLEGIEQTQIRPDKGYTFAIGLRAILRQDPDIILLGEIRDNETAETAIHAALTGHLVFTTLHTNDAAGAIPRLVDMKVNPTLIPPALN
ncbi:MAG: type II/IV secretion system protein, partial [Candidatus Omnitrophica bacterium]|nr:type II/IV secretion system protein [Candidatus Omnitrophota bacterium]